MLRLMLAFTVSLFFCCFNAAFAYEDSKQATIEQSTIEKDNTGSSEANRLSGLESNPDKQLNEKINEKKNKEKGEIVQISETEPSASLSQSEKNKEKSEIIAEEQADAISDLQVVDFLLTNQIENKEPKEVVETFTMEESKGFAFARIKTKSNQEVTFVWTRNDHEYARQTLNIQPSQKWRTYSSVKLKPGNWKVQLMSGSKVLAEKSFTVQT